MRRSTGSASGETSAVVDQAGEIAVGTNSGTAESIRDVAIRFLAENGPATLSLRALSQVPEPKWSRTAPLYHFGSAGGLMAAIAEHGFREVQVRLNTIRKAADASSGLLKQLALSYAEYALDQPHLYRTMHAAQLWREVTHRPPKRSVLGEISAEKAARWMDRAKKARDDAFEEFVNAVKAAQRAGSIRRGVDPKDAARCLTTVVDGFLFQMLEEHVDARISRTKQLLHLGRLIDLTLVGIADSSARRSK